MSSPRTQTKTGDIKVLEREHEGKTWRRRAFVASAQDGGHFLGMDLLNSW